MLDTLKGTADTLYNTIKKDVTRTFYPAKLNKKSDTLTLPKRSLTLNLSYRLAQLGINSMITGKLPTPNDIIMSVANAGVYHTINSISDKSIIPQISLENKSGVTRMAANTLNKTLTIAAEAVPSAIMLNSIKNIRNDNPLAANILPAISNEIEGYMKYMLASDLTNKITDNEPSTVLITSALNLALNKTVTMKNLSESFSKQKINDLCKTSPLMGLKEVVSTSNVKQIPAASFLPPIKTENFTLRNIDPINYSNFVILPGLGMLAVKLLTRQTQ